MMKIVLDAGYHGYVGIEYEDSRLPEKDGILATSKRLLEKVRRRICIDWLLNRSLLNFLHRLVPRKLREQLSHRLRLPGQNQIRRDLAQGLEHEPPLICSRMRKREFWRGDCFAGKGDDVQVQRPQLHSKLSWVVARPPFPWPAIFPEAIPAFHLFVAINRRLHSQTSANRVDNRPVSFAKVKI